MSGFLLPEGLRKSMRQAAQPVLSLSFFRLRLLESRAPMLQKMLSAEYRFRFPQQRTGPDRRPVRYCSLPAGICIRNTTPQMRELWLKVSSGRRLTEAELQPRYIAAYCRSAHGHSLCSSSSYLLHVLLSFVPVTICYAQLHLFTSRKEL